MQLSDSLEVGIGLSFIFFLASLVLASIQEIIESLLKTRGKRLYKGIVEMLDHPGAGLDGAKAAAVVYDHPLIRGLMRGDIKTANGFRSLLPSYLPARNFALALIDQAAKGKLAAEDSAGGTPAKGLPQLQQLRLTVEGIQNEQVRGALVHAIDTADGDFDRLRGNIEQWFNGAMDRVSGAYKRRSQRIIFTLGLGTALLLNVNTFIVADALSKSTTLREAVLVQAQKLEASADGTKQAVDAVAELDKTSLPVGWGEPATKVWDKYLDGSVGMQLELVVGYLMTAFAVTLGAPFWFDILNKLMVIRATVKPAEKSKDVASQDKQPPPAAGVTVNVSPPPDAPAPESAAPLPIDRDVHDEVPTAAGRLFEDDRGEPVPGIAAPETEDQ